MTEPLDLDAVRADLPYGDPTQKMTYQLATAGHWVRPLIREVERLRALIDEDALELLRLENQALRLACGLTDAASVHGRNEPCDHPARVWKPDPVFGSCGEGRWVCPGHNHDLAAHPHATPEPTP